MTYLKRLQPWCLVRPLPNVRHLVVARFRSRSDAIAHQQVLQQLVPGATYWVVYDPPPLPDSSVRTSLAKSN